MRALPAAATTLSLLMVAGAADAHLRVTQPTTRYGDQQKVGPCGVAGGVRSQNVHTFRPGATITIVWEEFINHPGHYRISFDDDGDDDFVDPAAIDDFYSAPSVLVDDIPDKNGGTYEYELTLPEIECHNCTLQVIQVMYDKPPFGNGNDMYYQCIDLILSNSAPETPDPGDPGDPGDPQAPDDPNAPPSGGEPELVGGCSVTLTAAGGELGMALVLLALGGMALANRRRPRERLRR
jgi:hypothetical protein